MQIEIDWLRLKWLSNESELFNTKYFPIPLTEEWLVKLGFERNDECLELEINDISLVWIGYITLNFNGTYIILNNEIIYLHQLQNLYFALTGEELTLTP